MLKEFLSQLCSFAFDLLSFKGGGWIQSCFSLNTCMSFTDDGVSYSLSDSEFLGLFLHTQHRCKDFSWVEMGWGVLVPVRHPLNWLLLDRRDRTTRQLQVNDAVEIPQDDNVRWCRFGVIDALIRIRMCLKTPVNPITLLHGSWNIPFTKKIGKFSAWVFLVCLLHTCRSCRDVLSFCFTLASPSLPFLIVRGSFA